jgi:6-phosphofructokinase
MSNLVVCGIEFLTSGGDCPGLKAVIYAVVMLAPLKIGALMVYP